MNFVDDFLLKIKSNTFIAKMFDQEKALKTILNDKLITGRL